MRIGDGLCRYGFLQKLHHLRRNFLSILNYRLSSNLYMVKKYSFQQICAFKSTCGRSASFCLTNARNLYCFQKYCQTFAAHIPGHVPSTSATDLFKFVQLDILKIYEDIRKELQNSTKELKEITTYYFDGSGKAFRPLIAVIMAKALNYHVLKFKQFLEFVQWIGTSLDVVSLETIINCFYKAEMLFEKQLQQKIVHQIEVIIYYNNIVLKKSEFGGTHKCNRRRVDLTIKNWLKKVPNCPALCEQIISILQDFP
ncbi:uncharacterized protein [Centruroides vittatus]|uniref:uncharacterized protein n=1 Tax=Centruroides vittatus TaxID=120091 RepID=UPI003510802E